jgi:hypothetical protein
LQVKRLAGGLGAQPHAPAALLTVAAHAQPDNPFALQRPGHLYHLAGGQREQDGVVALLRY